MSIERIEVGPRMSQAVIHNKTVYLAGQVASGAARAPGTSVSVQIRDILANIDALLSKAGSDKSQLLSATIWLVDMTTFAEMNAVWDAWVTPGATPARATVLSAQLASGDYKIEVAVTAAQKN
jgi:enamine deaminase RidA (YjgF/YER057c/UK114 family)